MRKSVSILALSWASLICGATVVLAEGSYDGLGQALAFMALFLLAYLTVFITLVVLAIRGSWHKFVGIGALACLVAVIFPLADTMLLNWQASRVANQEIRSGIPDLKDKRVLYVSSSDRCSSNLCQAISRLQDSARIWVITPDTLQTLDLSRPVDLTTVPMSLWIADQHNYSYQPAEAVPQDQMPDRPEFDYVVVAQYPFFASKPGSIEEALNTMPRVIGLNGKLVLDVLAAPVTDQMLDLGTIQPDYLKVRIQRNAYAPPLFPENVSRPPGRSYRATRHEHADAFCEKAEARFENCDFVLEDILY